MKEGALQRIGAVLGRLEQQRREHDASVEDRRAFALRLYDRMGQEARRLRQQLQGVLDPEDREGLHDQFLHCCQEHTLAKSALGMAPTLKVGSATPDDPHSRPN